MPRPSEAEHESPYELFLRNLQFYPRQWGREREGVIFCRTRAEPSHLRGRGSCRRIVIRHLSSSKDPIPRIPQPWQNVTLLIELPIDRGAVQRNLWMLSV